MTKPTCHPNHKPGGRSWFRRRLRILIITALTAAVLAMAAWLAGCQTYARIDWHTWTVQLKDNVPYDMPTSLPAR